MMNRNIPINVGMSLPERLEDANKIIKTFSSLPSCHKVATAALMHSCSAPRDSDEPSAMNVVLSDAWKAYGAGLAVCELLEAQADIPPNCAAFVPNEANTKKRAMAGYLFDESHSKPSTLYPQYDEITNNRLGGCLTALEQRPQSWTSYSNSKQNAVVICHTLQGELQMEQSIKTYKNIMQSLGLVGEQHEQMAQMYQNQFFETQAAVAQFLVDLETRWRGMHTDMADTTAEYTKAHGEQLFQVLMNASMTTQLSLQKVNESTTDFAARLSAFLGQQEMRVTDLATQMEYVTQYAAQHLLSELGKISEGFDLQQDIVLEINSAINKLASNIGAVAIQVSRTNAELQASELSAKEVSQVLVKMNQTAGDAAQSLASLTWFLQVDWPSVAGKAALFLVCVAVIPLLSFGLWERWAGLSCKGNWAAAVGTGLATGFTACLYVNPTTFLRASPTDVFQDELHASRELIATFLVIGALLGAAVCMGTQFLCSTIHVYMHSRSLELSQLDGDNKRNAMSEA
ncbi:hypothetical protein BDY17DRAFT_110125 [Neohortaea acidophila]|uniref:Karyogamy protein 5 n=1 Tax=Neohortaea acidophila TaxID=245834 RepID=A0A6A6Q2P9_9PEZI|nr:uncharacterized protein BDY17DRAFT_110125 [Neohortaea acidophila]KAF2485697.1 hypothetical protein BDY17DRAFT_110125 [Neohortaea acidophila]